MPDSVVVAGLAPHPPIIIPEIGRGEEKQAISTIRAMEELGKACGIKVGAAVAAVIDF